MNQAEVIHTGWAHRDPTNLSLLEACHADVRDSTILDVELKAYADGAATGGDGPSYVQRRRKQYVREINQAKQLGREMFERNTVNDGLVVDPSSSHRPLERRKKRSHS